MPQGAPAPLRRIQRHVLWLVVAFFIALSYFAVRNLGEKFVDRENARLIHAWTETSVAFSQLIHELQKERGMSSGFIASSGAKFTVELPAQRLRTDQAAAQLTARMAALSPSAKSLVDLSRSVLEETGDLPGLRSRIDAHSLSREYAVDQYSLKIWKMFDHLLSTMSVGHIGWIVRHQMSFIFFLYATEMSGQERALVTAMLASNDFGSVRMNAYHRIRAVEKASLDQFLQLGDERATATFKELMEQPFIAEAERIRRLVVAVGASGETPDIRLPSAEKWFGIATLRINAMDRFQRSLSDRLLTNAQSIESEAQVGLIINAVAAFISFFLAGGLMFQIWRGKEVAERNLHLAGEVFDNSVESIIVTDADVRIVNVNPAFSRISGYAREEAIGQHPRLFKSGRHDKVFYEAMWEKLLRTGSWEGEIWNRRKSGAIYPALLSIAAVRNARGEISNYIAMVVDLSKFKETEALLEQLRTFDPLTGLPNRESWQSAVDQAVASARRTAGHFAVLDIGLDRFKAINESFGHAVGDLVLAAIAERIKDVQRRHDVAARPSGNHFAILLQDMSDPAEIGSYCERLLAAFAHPVSIDDHQFSLSISIGVVIFPADGDDTRVLLQNAESALHAARDQGGARYAFYSVEMNATSAKMLALEQMMRQALARSEFSLAYQPQVDATDGRLVGVEALLRWNNPELGQVSPAHFIPIAEATGLIVPIGEWVLHEACRQAHSWLRTLGAEIPVAVNLSARQFASENLLDTVRRILDETGLPTHLLELEITEGALMNDPAGATATMQELRGMGIKLALDDFGTGYSSLAYLKNFPLDRLKLDRAFVIDLARNNHDQAIAQTVISLGHHLDMDVLAEGIETEEQRDILRRFGCDVFQGYLHGRPMPPGQLEARIHDGQLALRN